MYLLAVTLSLLWQLNRQRVSELRTEAGRCRDLARRKNRKVTLLDCSGRNWDLTAPNSQVAEKEREARRMREEAVRVGNHADKLKRDRARNLQEIDSKLRLVILVMDKGLPFWPLLTRSVTLFRWDLGASLPAGCGNSKLPSKAGTSTGWTGMENKFDVDSNKRNTFLRPHGTYL